MIDTVCLLVPLNECTFLDKNNTEIPDWDLQARTKDYQRFVRNPTKADKTSGMYFPRVTLYKRKLKGDILQNVKIEFSAPKLIYGNNLEELIDGDFGRIVETLAERLKHVGVRIFQHSIENAKVSAIHYSKNILLTNGHTAIHLISEIGKIDLRKSFDFSRARFINDGQSLCAHTDAHELVIYDKVADLNKGKKRAIDRDQTPRQIDLFKEFKERKELIEILRFEIRLCKRVKMKSLFKTLVQENDFTFKQMFKNDVSRKVVLYYWKKIINARNNGLFTLSRSNKDLLREIYRSQPRIKPKQAIFLIGLSALATEGNGLGELRSIVSKTAKDRTWGRIMEEHRAFAKTIPQDRIRDWVEQIDMVLKEYKPYKISL